jgi:hypothetical protein
MLEQWQCAQHRMRTVRRRIYAAHLTVCRGIIEQLEQVEIDAFPTAFVTEIHHSRPPSHHSRPPYSAVSKALMFSPIALSFPETKTLVKQVPCMGSRQPVCSKFCLRNLLKVRLLTATPLTGSTKKIVFQAPSHRPTLAGRPKSESARYRAKAAEC